MLRVQDVNRHSDYCPRRTTVSTAALDRGLRTGIESLVLYLAVCLVWGCLVFLAITQAL